MHSLKRRFLQTHETTSYTILALLPTLSAQILTEMNVEALTKELQSRSAKKPVQLAPPSPSIASSIEVINESDGQPSSSSASLSVGEASSSQLLDASIISLRSEATSLGGSASPSVASAPELVSPPRVSSLHSRN